MNHSPVKPNKPMNDTETAQLYDGMADEYDDIKDLWYGWLFSRLHYLIVKYLRQNPLKHPQRCLDVGCGTGFQSILLGLCGFEVTGIDISQGLIAKAKKKTSTDYMSTDLFESPFSFVHDYSSMIRSLVIDIRRDKPPKIPKYQVGSATDIPFDNESFDIVNCCGSTLSAIHEYEKALDELTRVLRPNGILIIEVENRYNPDLIWPLVDSVLGGRIGYDQEVRVSLRNLVLSPGEHVKIDFPFSTHSGEVPMPIWLFSARTLVRQLIKRGVIIDEVHAIHNLTNIIPSVVLDRTDPPNWLMNAFSALSRIEKITGSWPLLRRFGCSIVLFGKKAQ